MEDLIRIIVQALVDHPDQVSIFSINGNRTSVFELRVAKADLGKVIGKHGRNVQSIRALLQAASGRVNKKMILEVVE